MVNHWETKDIGSSSTSTHEVSMHGMILKVVLELELLGAIAASRIIYIMLIHLPCMLLLRLKSLLITAS